MKIIGIDPGYGITGFGIISIDQKKHISLEDSGIITTDTNIPFYERLHVIASDLRKILNRHAPEHAAIEQLFFAQNTTTALNVAHARGVILEQLSSMHIPISEYTPLEVKQTITGFGRATKDQIMRMVKLTLKIGALPKPDDAVDAIAIALCYAFRQNFDMLGTQKQIHSTI